MATNRFNRRSFLKGSASAAALMSLPVPGFSQTTLPTRLEWQAFKTTPQYASFLNAVKLMKAVTDATNPASWQYWVNVHLNYCPHMVPYFLAWHRGYLYYFEQQLRTVSGDGKLTLPYWDYYTYPRMPSEFTDPASGNPLYVSGRVNTDVYAALTLAPFASNIINMQRGTSNSYEASFESAPHNPVHNIIGGWMADMSSPTDPIFYLHHGNVDRLWDAWCAEPPTLVPAPTSSYWSGSFTYAKNLTMSKSKCYRPETLNYQYSQPNQVPAALPQNAQEGRIIRVQAQLAPILVRPAFGNFSNTAARAISNSRRSLGGVANVTLRETSVSARLPLQASDISALKDALSAAAAASGAAAGALANTTTFKYPHLVLDKLSITALGKQGGYYYNIYLNLPAAGNADAARESHFVGTFGPFEASGAIHHNRGMLMLSLSDVLQNLGVNNLNEAVISLVRVNGPNSPKGDVLSVGEMRVELSTDGP